MAKTKKPVILDMSDNYCKFTLWLGNSKYNINKLSSLDVIKLLEAKGFIKLQYSVDGEIVED